MSFVRRTKQGCVSAYQSASGYDIGYYWMMLGKREEDTA